MFLNDCHLTDQLICGILRVPRRLGTSSVREPKANRNGSEAEGKCLHQDSNPGPTDQEVGGSLRCASIYRMHAEIGKLSSAPKWTFLFGSPGGQSPRQTAGDEPHDHPQV